MKKIFAIFMTICLLTSVLCITAFAAESTSVIKVQIGSKTKEFDNFEDGWNFAMEEANDGKEVYATLLTDWIAAVGGKFTDDTWNGDGFDNDTIYFADDVKVTLDLGGHTIDRGLMADELNGEVMFINNDANVTIKNGTIKGGYSSNGAGGIHIEGAKVNLIDLVITKNSAMNMLDGNGTAIHHDDGGELYMKNCRIVDNDGSLRGLDMCGAVYLDDVDKVLIEDCYFSDNDNIDYGGGIHADNCEDFVIKNTTFENLNADDRGGAIWVGGSIIDDPNGNAFTEIYIYNCKFSNNSAGNYGGAIYSKMAELHVYDSEFKGNYSDWDGGAVYLTAGDLENGGVPSCFYRSTFDGNRAGWDGGAIYCDAGMSIMTSAKTYGCDFINNSAEENGGAVGLDSDCSFEFNSDNETGKAGTIKNNSAGELGGGVYQGNRAGIRLSGEIYASGNVSSAGDDDLHIRDTAQRIFIYNITSPEGSIGLRYKNDKGDRLTTLDDTNIDVNPKVFFVNNEGFEVVRGEYRYSNRNDTMIPCLNIAKKPAPVASIFGEGSLTTILVIISLIASGVAIFLTVYYNKKKAAPVAVDAKETEDEE